MIPTAPTGVVLVLLLAFVSARPQAPTAASEDAKYAYKGPIYKPEDPNVYVYDPNNPNKAWNYPVNAEATPAVSVARSAAPYVGDKAARANIRTIQLRQNSAPALPVVQQFPVAARATAIPQFPVAAIAPALPQSPVAARAPALPQFPVAARAPALPQFPPAVNPQPVVFRSPASTFPANQPFTAFNH